MISNSYDDLSCIESNFFDTYHISCLSLNIRSLRRNFDIFLATFDQVIKNIDLIVLTETNINDEETNSYAIDDFDGHFFNRQSNRGGGIAVYIKDEIRHELIVTDTVHFESIHVRLTKQTQNFSLIAIYRPPSQHIKRFIEELDKIIKEDNEITLILGDVNIDINHENNSNTMLYLDMLSHNGVQSINKDDTRVDINRGTKTNIDHILVKCKKDFETTTAVIKTNISDHYTVLAKMTILNNTQKDFNKNITKKTIISDKKLNEITTYVNWTNMINMNENNINEFYGQIEDTYKILYKNSEITITNNKKRQSKPWITQDVIRMCKKRDELYKKWLSNPYDNNIEQEYKKFRNRTTNAIRNTKNEYYRTKFKQNRGDIKNTWEIINEIIGKKTKNLDNTLRKNFMTNDAEQIANILADTFKDNITNVIHDCSIQTSTTKNNTLRNTIYLEETDENEISNIIKRLNTQKGPGYDLIRAKDIKNNMTLMTPSITKLINMSIRQGEIPKSLKTSIIRPLYKSGSKSDPKNYRPISILPTIEKIMEEVILTRTQSFITKYNIINNNQFGFQKGKNINKLLGKFASHINNNLANTKHSLVLFIDFTKAFDTLPHNKIIKTLYDAGIRGPCIKWIENYLKDRTFTVKVDNKYSKEIKMTHGVPQGSKLGPILYILYTNNLLQMTSNCEIFAYADDTAVVVSHKNIKEATKIMQDKIVEIQKWCHDNGLTINEKKTKLLHIRGPHMDNTKIELKFHDLNCIHEKEVKNNDLCNTYVEQVDKYDYLGVTVDEKLKWHDHIQKLRTKLRKTSYILKRLSYCSNQSVLRQVYYAIGESHIRHGITAWGTSTSCNKLQKSQNYLLKIMDYNTENNDETITINEKLNILDIKSIYQLAVLCEFESETTILQKIDHKHSTRVKKTHTYKIKNFKNNYARNTLEVQLPTIMNDIPQHLLLKKNMTRKMEIKKYFLQAQKRQSNQK